MGMRRFKEAQPGSGKEAATLYPELGRLDFELGKSLNSPYWSSCFHRKSDRVGMPGRWP